MGQILKSSRPPLGIFEHLNFLNLIHTALEFRLFATCPVVGENTRELFFPKKPPNILWNYKKYIYIIYTCKLYKLINLCWSTGCFVKLHFTPRDDFIEGFSTVNIQNVAGLCCLEKFRRAVLLKAFCWPSLGLQAICWAIGIVGIASCCTINIFFCVCS